MFHKTLAITIALVLLTAGLVPMVSAAPAAQDYLLCTTAPLSADQVDQLKAAGATVRYVYQNFEGAAISMPPGQIADVQALPFVLEVSDDMAGEAAAYGATAAAIAPLPDGRAPFWLDLIDAEKNTTYDGSGVWVAVLDTGFYPNWRDYFDEDSILTEYATAFVGANATLNENRWDGAFWPHGMAVAATIIGFHLQDGLNEGNYGGQGPLDLTGYLTGAAGEYYVPGIAPGAKIIPVRVAGNRQVMASDVFAGFDYIIGLKNAHPDQPIVINYSDALPKNLLMKAAMDRTIQAGIIVVAAAGNAGVAGMMWPAAYEPLISAGSGGWTGQWNGYPDKTWWLDDVPENGVSEIFVSRFSSRPRPGFQYLDVLAPGQQMVVPYPCPNLVSENLGNCSGRADPDGEKAAPFTYIFGNGTSFSSPMVAGIVALMLDKNPSLNNSDATYGSLADPASWGPGTVERLLESAATQIPPGTVVFINSAGVSSSTTWDANATGAGWVFVDAVLAAVPEPAP